MQRGDASFRDMQDWEILSSFLPAGWQQQAKALGAMRRARYIKEPATVLRLLLMHLASGCSLAETAARASASGLAQISAVGVFKRLRSAEGWLRWLAQQMRQEPGWEMAALDRRLRAVDATAVSEPGATGTDWRVHYALNLASLECDFFELTGVHEGGETFRRFPVQAGDVMLGDRIYATPPGVAHVADAGADVVVRVNRQSLPLYDRYGRRVDLLARLRDLRAGAVLESRTRVKHPRGGWLPGRLIAVRRSAEATEQARRRLRDRARRNQRKVSAESLEFAAYFLLWTTLDERTLRAPDVLSCYRTRWQIELVFKRMKSILGLGHLPKTDEQSAKAWLVGKIFVGLMIERMIAEADSISPWGYRLDQTPQPLARG